MFKEKVIKGLICLLAIMLAAKGWAVAKEATQGTGTAEAIEPKLVMEWKFDEPVVDVIWSEATMTVKEARALGVKGLEKRKATEKVKVQCLRVAFVPRVLSFRTDEIRMKEVRFYEEKRKKRKSLFLEIESDKVVKSPSGKYIAISKTPSEYNPQNIGGAVYKNDGRLVWKIDEGPSPLSINEEGYVVAAYKDWGGYAPGDFVFFDPTGNEIGRIENPLLKRGFDTGCGNAEFTPNGEYVVLGFTHLGQKTIMMLTTKRGEILWMKEFDYRSWFPYESAILEKVGIIGIWDKIEPSQTYAFFIDWQGNLKWMVPLDTRGDISVHVSDDYKKAIICSSRGYLFCIDVDSGVVTWKHKEDWADIGVIAKHPPHKPLFDEIAIVKNCICIRGTYENEKRDWCASALLIFDTNTGTLLKKIEYPEKKIYLQTSKDKLFIIDATSKKVSLFEVE